MDKIKAKNAIISILKSRPQITLVADDVMPQIFNADEIADLVLAAIEEASPPHIGSPADHAAPHSAGRKPGPSDPSPSPDVRKAVQTLKRFADLFRDGAHGCDMGSEATKSLALAIDSLLSGEHKK